MKYKTGPVLAALLITSTLLLAARDAPAGPWRFQQPQLASQIDYWFVGQNGVVDDQGRLLVWEGTIQGGLNGTVRWWFELPGPVPLDAFYNGGRISFYAARWEVWSDDRLVLAGMSSGKTVFADGTDGIWDGHGVVTETSRKYRHWYGRKISETGTVIVGDTPPLSYAGTGLFSVY